LRAERVVQAAGNIEPVIADQFLFHDESPIPDAIRIARFAGARAARHFYFDDEPQRRSVNKPFNWGERAKVRDAAKFQPP
jgi:hypothetical protein